MPFPTRAVEERQDILDVYQDNAQNILQKNNVSNLIGILQQLNMISSYASEIFSDILEETKKNNNKISNYASRLKKLETKVLPTEQQFIKQSPAYFYDNPYTGKEWQRNDPLRGLLFRRDRCTKEVNRRRNYAEAPPNLSALDHLSMNGKCINSYTDTHFFMNEWLEAEKRKMAEEKKNRKEKKKKKRAKRKKQKTIAAVKKARYDPVTGKKIEVTQEDIAVKQYTLSGDTDTVNQVFTSNDDNNIDSKYNQRVSGMQKSAVAQMANNNNNKKSSKNKQSKQQQKQQQQQKNTHQSATSYANLPAKNISAAIQPGGNNASGPPPVPPPNPMQNNNNGGNNASGPPPVPPPFNPGGNNNNASGPPVPPPNPMMQNGGGNNNLSANGPPPVPVKKKLTGAEMAALSAKAADDRNMYAQQHAAPPQPQKKLMPMKSALLLTDITKGTKLKKTQIVKRQIPKDKRSMLMSALRDKKQLKHVDKKEINKPKEEKVDGTIYEILNRRKIMNYESESSEDDSSWGSEEE